MTVNNSIAVTACDNELVILACQWGGSFELCRILSGNYNTVNVTIAITDGQYQGPVVLNGVNGPLNETISVSLTPGSYNLAFVGLNWGGPKQFTIAYTNNSGITYNYSLPASNPGTQFGGVVWVAQGPLTNVATCNTGAGDILVVPQS